MLQKHRSTGAKLEGCRHVLPKSNLSYVRTNHLTVIDKQLLNEVSVILLEYPDDKKIYIIKAVQTVTGLGLPNFRVAPCAPGDRENCGARSRHPFFAVTPCQASTRRALVRSARRW